MDSGAIIIIVSLVLCALANAYCCAFIHVERYIALHEPLAAIPLYNSIAKIGLGVPAILFWIIPTIVVSIVTANIFAGIVYFVAAQLLAPTSLITVYRFRRRIMKPNMESKEPWKEDRNDFYEWMIKHPATIMDFSRIPVDPFLTYMELAHPGELDEEIQIDF